MPSAMNWRPWPMSLRHPLATQWESLRVRPPNFDANQNFGVTWRRVMRILSSEKQLLWSPTPLNDHFRPPFAKRMRIRKQNDQVNSRVWPPNFDANSNSGVTWRWLMRILSSEWQLLWLQKALNDEFTLPFAKNQKNPAAILTTQAARFQSPLRLRSVAP